MNKEKKKESLKGVFPLMPLCVKENQEIDYDGFKYNADLLAERGMPGFIVLGAMGQMHAVSENEYNRVCDVCIKAAKKNDLLCIVGSSSINTQETIRKAVYAESSGADASMIALPYAFPITTDWAMEFYGTLDESIQGDMGIMVYDAPGYSGFAITSDLWNKYLFDIESIVALKESNWNTFYHDDVVASIADKINVFTGCESPFWHDSLSGAKGIVGILTWIAPKAVLHYFRECMERNQTNEWVFSTYRILTRIMAESRDLGLHDLEHGTLNFLVELGGGKAGPPRKPYGRLPRDIKNSYEEILQPLLNIERSM
jgi:dihydrodipicolinate synthase/N-acetylneuraminate lyase